MTRVLELSGITKRFGHVTANEDVSLHLDRGEIVALLGENGAGKTTLMSILFGHYTADAGHVRVDGQELPPGRSARRDPRGRRHGAPAFRAGPEPDRAGQRDDRHGSPLEAALRPGGGRGRSWPTSRERFGLKVDPDARVSELSVGECQRVEILKALYNDARILILDEPTAVLTAQEAEGLFATLRQMTRDGLSLIFISHKLHEVMAAADRVVVLRRGRVVAERDTPGHDEGGTGRTDGGPQGRTPRARRRRRRARSCSNVADLSLDKGGSSLRGVSFRLRAGETLGHHRGFGQRTDDAGGAGLRARPARQWRAAGPRQRGFGF